MMPTSNGVVWMPSEHEAVSSWDNNEEENTCKSLGININPHPSYPLTTSLKSMLENEWLVTNSINNSHGFLGSNHPEFTSHNNLLLPSMDSSSCYPSQSHSQFFAPKSSFSSLLNLPYDSGFDLGCDSVFMTNCESPVLMSYNGLNSVPNRELGSTSEFASTHLVQISDDIDNSSAGIGFNGVEFDRFEGPSLGNDDMSKMLRPLEALPTESEHQQQQQHQTLFEKRADFREGSDMGNLGKFEDLVKKRKRNVNEDGDEFDEGSIDISGSFNYDSDEFETKNVNNNYGGGSEIWDNSNANDSVTVGEKGKKKGLPAKNLMAERRRRKKLNDRLYMLRSIVPKISKMDRASILGDAVDYLKELLQRINDLNNELEATPPGSSTTTPTSSFQPLTPAPVTFPYHVKEEMHSGSLPSPKNTSARVEVRAREGRAVNIHMFCARRPGLLLSTMRALDSLELDIQQAVISCFNGFALDIFRAEQCNENKDVLPEQIKAVLLDSVGFHGAM